MFAAEPAGLHGPVGLDCPRRNHVRHSAISRQNMPQMPKAIPGKLACTQNGDLKDPGM
jgi:hypothetical protein